MVDSLQRALSTAVSLTVLLTAQTRLHSQVRSNFSVLDSLIARAVVAVIGSVQCDSVAVVPTDSPAQWLVAEKLVASGIRVRPSAPCIAAIADCAVRYALHPRARDSVERTFTVELRLMTPDTLTRASAHYRDYLARHDIPAAELPRSALTSSPVPPPPHSLWDDVLEPLVVVGSVATTLLLLFTVRSR